MIGIIGWGHVGQVLGQFLLKRGYEKIYFYEPFYKPDTDPYQNRGLIERVESLEDLVNRSTILFITVPDDAIGDVSASVAALGVSLKGKLMIHTSGAHGVDLLRELEERQAEIASVHPLMAFNDIEVAVKNLERAYLTVEETGRSVLLEGFLQTIGNPIMRVSSDKKALYHAGACVLSNYLTVVMSYGLQMMEEATGGTEDEVLEAALPLIMSAIENAKALGVGHALTGPLKRQDMSTIHKHYDALGSGQRAELYHQLVAATLHYMEQFNYPHERLDAEMKQTE